MEQMLNIECIFIVRIIGALIAGQFFCYNSLFYFGLTCGFFLSDWLLSFVSVDVQYNTADMYLFYNSINPEKIKHFSP